MTEGGEEEGDGRVDVRGGEGEGGDTSQLHQEGDLGVEGAPCCVACQLLISLTKSFSDGRQTADDEWWRRK